MKDYKRLTDREIAEMAKAIDSYTTLALNTLGSHNNGRGMWYAEKLYDAGYRKQSDTVREFVDRIAEFASAMRLLANKEYEESRLVKAMYAQGKMDAFGYMMKEIKKLAAEYGAEVEE